MLVFKDRVHFQLIVFSNANKKNEQKNSAGFAARSGGGSSFISMKTAYDSLNNSQLRISDSLELLETNNPGTVSVTTFNETHSPLLRQFDGSYFINTLPDGTKCLEINARDFSIAEIINKDGFVQIGDTLHKINFDTLKMKIGGNPSDTTLLNNATVSDPANGIIITVQIPNGTLSRITGFPEHAAIRKDCRKTSGRARVIGYYNMITYRFSQTPLVFVPEHWVRAIALRRRLFGVWWDNAGSGADISVSWNTSGNTSSGFFVPNPNTFTGGSVSWGVSGSDGRNFGSPFERPISYNPATQGAFRTQIQPIIFQARTRNTAAIFTPNGTHLGTVQCECSYDR